MFEDRVRRGAKLLDRIRPGWWRAIAADRLAMESCHHCILGQLYGGFLAGWLDYIRPFVCRREIVPPSAYGFTLTVLEQAPLHGPARFVALADAWRAEIAARAMGETYHV
jgi:hypothetical protein